MARHELHIQLDISVNMDGSGDFPFSSSATKHGVVGVGREQVFQPSEAEAEETSEEFPCLVEPIELMNHHVQVQPESIHLTCGGNMYA